jgi:Spy/CpxP family protein refolding chaperone
MMLIVKTLAIAAALAVGASSFALAQQGNPARNAAASGGSGTHQSSQKTGSAANTQKVLKNQNGYRRQQ